MLLVGILIVLPGVPVAYVLSNMLPPSAQVLSGLASLAVSIYVSTNTPWRKVLEKVWPDLDIQND